MGYEWVAVAAGFFLALFWELASRTKAKRRERRIVAMIERVQKLAERLNGNDPDVDMGAMRCGEPLERN
jgi:hypothetical protein